MSTTKGPRWIGILTGVVAISIGSAASVRAQVTVTNAGFELPVVAAAGFTQAVPPGWTLVSGLAANTGVFHPTESTWQYVAPSGNQLLYLNGATVEQELVTTVVEGEPYLLLVRVIRRPGFWSPNYRIDFFAGDVLLGADLGTLVPAEGESLSSMLAYTAGAGDPAIGQPLKIRLGGAIQTNFDDVRVVVPEPAVGAALWSVIPAAGLLLFRVRPTRS